MLSTSYLIILLWSGFILFHVVPSTRISPCYLTGKYATWRWRGVCSHCIEMIWSSGTIRRLPYHSWILLIILWTSSCALYGPWSVGSLATVWSSFWSPYGHTQKDRGFQCYPRRIGPSVDHHFSTGVIVLGCWWPGGPGVSSYKFQLPSNQYFRRCAHSNADSSSWDILKAPFLLYPPLLLPLRCLICI